MKQPAIDRAEEDRSASDGNRYAIQLAERYFVEIHFTRVGYTAGSLKQARNQANDK